MHDCSFHCDIKRDGRSADSCRGALTQRHLPIKADIGKEHQLASRSHATCCLATHSRHPQLHTRMVAARSSIGDQTMDEHLLQAVGELDFEQTEKLLGQVICFLTGCVRDLDVRDWGRETRAEKTKISKT